MAQGIKTLTLSDETRVGISAPTWPKTKDFRFKGIRQRERERDDKDT